MGIGNWIAFGLAFLWLGATIEAVVGAVWRGLTSPADSAAAKGHLAAAAGPSRD
jgi:hypothetical protein